MPHLIYIRNALRPDGVSAKVAFDDQGNKPFLDEADRRAGLVDSRELEQWHVEALERGDFTLRGLCLRLPCRGRA